MFPLFLAQKDTETRRRILQQWWNENRERLQKGEFAKLHTVPLWPAEPGTSVNWELGFIRDDYFAALRSPYSFVRELTIQRIAKSWHNHLSQHELALLAEAQAKPSDFVRKSAADLLGRQGDAGVTLLKEALAAKDDEVRSCAAMALLKYTPHTPENHRRYLQEIVTAIPYSAEESHGCVTLNFVDLYPKIKAEIRSLLKERVLDLATAEGERLRLEFLFTRDCTKTDATFLLTLMQPNQPLPIRQEAVRALVDLFPQSEPSAFIRRVANDPIVGRFFVEHGYEPGPTIVQ